MEQPKVFPLWAPRVPQHKIRRLYLDDAEGMHDEALLDDVGYALRARCESFIAACEAAHGRAVCPVCATVVPHTGDKSEIMRCAQCGWELTWGEYFTTFQHKQLSGAEPVLEQFRVFVEGFPKARTSRDKMLRIDRLIHGFHWYHRFGCTRPVAVNLIQGRLSEVIAFLDELSSGAPSTPGIAETHAAWQEGSRNVRRWLSGGPLLEEQ